MHAFSALATRFALFVARVEDPEAVRVVRARMDVLHQASQRAMRLLWSNGGDFQGVWMTEQEDGSFAGEIPAQPQGTTVGTWSTMTVRIVWPSLATQCWHSLGCPSMASRMSP